MLNSVLICGAGPTGLALANDLAMAGIDVVLIEKSEERSLAEPVFDGREIALTHKSTAILRRLGAWERLAADAVHPLTRAKVYNGQSPLALAFMPDANKGGQLGSMVSNCDIRRALFDCAAARANIKLMTGVSVGQVITTPTEGRITLGNGQCLSGQLVVAADSRFSTLRSQLGIAARMYRLGKSMLVGRVGLDRDHCGLPPNGSTMGRRWQYYRLVRALLPLSLHCPMDRRQHWPTWILARSAQSLRGAFVGVLGQWKC